MKTTLLAVVGMHRSGTSATAGAFAQLGVDFGPAPLLMKPSRDNPKGYFEATLVVGIHDRLLRGLSGSWESPFIRGDWPLTIQANVARRQILEWVERLPAGTTCGVKDPRMSLFYPLWENACNEAGVRLIPCCVIRELESVVRSLQRRDGFDPWHCREIAERYGEGVLEWSKAPGATVIHFEDLVDDPAGAMQPTLDALMFNPDEGGWERVLDFLDGSLVHG